MDSAVVSLKSNLVCYAVRLEPGSDFVQSLKKFIQQQNITSAFILTCVGSLSQAKVRLANASPLEEDYIYITEPAEIVSLVGTMSSDGMHLHISLADREGKVIGGHLTSDNAIVHTTVELVIGSCTELIFKREFDEKTGYKELKVLKNI